MSHLTLADRQHQALRLKQLSAAPPPNTAYRTAMRSLGAGAVVCRDYRKVNAESSTGGDRGCGWSCSRNTQGAVGSHTVYR